MQKYAECFAGEQVLLAAFGDAAAITGAGCAQVMGRRRENHFDTDHPVKPFEPVTRLLDCERSHIGQAEAYNVFKAQTGA